MSISTTTLNLARKWRPQTFDTVVGQDIAIRMLKNSLFLNKFFPVYLFAGQRGCGKTSSARIFAAALNCANLEIFQKDPKAAIPCLNCSSCQAMSRGDHPDFTEIDAASHTGVDNVRSIIESSSYMPLAGKKKIYLIDEAHMLSKAAFNAFLKILEEPPLTVLFILATTEVPKIPATVLSRCFQLTFNPIHNTNLKAHLQTICANEGVIIEDAALDILLNETEGSARDAINLLERVRFSSDSITEQTILSVLGKISHVELFTLFDFIIDQQIEKLLQHLQIIHFEERSPQLLWDMLIQLCRTLIWIKYGAQSSIGAFGKHLNNLEPLARKCSLARLTSILNLFWEQEELFLKTTKKHLFIEMVLLQLCQQVNAVDLADLLQACNSLAGNSSTSSSVFQPTTLQSTHEPTRVENSVRQNSIPPQDPLPAQNHTKSLINQDWSLFLQAVDKLGDPFLSSILMQAHFIGHNEIMRKITISLNNDSVFFKNKLEETKTLWQPHLAQAFSGSQEFEFAPGDKDNKLHNNPQEAPKPSSYPLPSKPQTSASKPLQVRESETLIIKDHALWPQTSLILRYFQGKIKKLGREESAASS